MKFTEQQHQQIKTILWLEVRIDPTQSISSYVRGLHRRGFLCSREYVRRIFHQWRWSFKKPTYRQLQKYTVRNQEYYFGFLIWLASKRAEWQHFKFMDEVHFVSSGTSILFLLLYSIFVFLPQHVFSSQMFHAEEESRRLGNQLLLSEERDFLSPTPFRASSLCSDWIPLFSFQDEPNQTISWTLSTLL
jgi:hypothetical protein